MQIVIDIPREQYSLIMQSHRNGVARFVDKEAMMYAIKNGTPLQKGHGRIGDLDVLREEVSSWGMNDYEPSDFTDAIDQADVIIEADKAESE